MKVSYKISESANVFDGIRSCLWSHIQKKRAEPEEIELSTAIFNKVKTYVPSLTEDPILFGISVSENLDLDSSEIVFKHHEK